MNLLDFADSNRLHLRVTRFNNCYVAFFEDVAIKESERKLVYQDGTGPSADHAINRYIEIISGKCLLKNPNYNIRKTVLVPSTLVWSGYDKIKFNGGIMEKLNLEDLNQAKKELMERLANRACKKGLFAFFGRLVLIHRLNKRLDAVERAIASLK